jgi:outer membrane protein OmpA-like peptidoglycan-associated protein
VATPVVAKPQQPQPYKPRALNAPILFHLNSMDLTDASYRIFKHIVASLQENTPQKIIVVGYTCSMGDEKDNLHLGKYRAEKIKYLLEQNGLQHVTIETETRGENNPHLPNTTEQNRKQNRCVDLIYIY